MLLKDFFKNVLDREYLGKTIYTKDKTITFVVYNIIVMDGGVDPQWEFLLESKLCHKMNEESTKWQNENNPRGGNLAPKELEDRWRKGWVECYIMSFADDEIPEIVEIL